MGGLHSSLAVLVLAQSAILLIPYLWVRRTFYSPPDLHGNLDHAIEARKAQWLGVLPLTVLVFGSGVLWLDSGHDVALMLISVAATCLSGRQASRSVRSIPVLTRWFGVLITPSVALFVATVSATRLASPQTWFEWLITGAWVLTGTSFLIIVVAAAVAWPLLLGKRLWYRRLLRGRWVSSAGWGICDVGKRGDTVVLYFTPRRVMLLAQTGEPPHFVVEVTLDETWSPDPERLSAARLPDYPGPGPITEVMFGSAGPNLRAAAARLDKELHVMISETALGGDDFFQFITSLRPVGHP